MSLEQRLNQLDRKVKKVGDEAREKGIVIIIRKLWYRPNARLTSYQDPTGKAWPLDESQWPPVPGGTHVVLEEVWSDDMGRGTTTQSAIST